MFSWNSGYRSRVRLSGRRASFTRLIAGGFLLVFGAVSIGPAISAAEGHGTKGYFVAQSQTCRRHGCTWPGEFRLPDGQVTRTGVGFEGSDPSMQVGTVLPALDTGDISNVFPRQGDTTWLFDLAMVLGGTGLIGYQIVTWARQRRAGTPGMTDSGGDSVPQLV